MREVLVRLRLDISDYRAKAVAAAGQAKAFAKELENSADKRQALNEIGGSFGKIGLAAGVAGAAMTKAFADFDEAMSAVEATGQDARDNIADLRDLAVEMGAKTKFNATESAAAIEAMAKAGVSAKDILGGGLSGALDLAAAGGLEVADAAEIAATSMNQFGLAGRDVPHIADLLAAAAGKAMGDVEDMSAAFKFVGPVANQMGISIEETAGTIALLAQQGVLGEQAGTSLRGMLTSLSSPSKQAAKEMARLGINVYDAQGQFVGFDGVAGQLKGSLQDLKQSERDQALGRIFGNEQITTARLLYQAGSEDVRKWTKAVDDQGFASDTAATKMDNLKGDVEQLGGALETAFIGTGEGADGPLRQITQSVTGLVDAYNDLPDPAKSATLAALGLTTAVGGGAFVLSRAVTGYANLKDNLNTLGASFENANKKAMAIRGGAAVAGVALLALSDKASETDEGLGVLADAAGGALTGFAVGGPWGAAIGGGIGALTGLSKATGQAAKAFDSGRASASEYAATMDGVAGSVTKATRAVIFDDLNKTNAVRAARALGIANRDLVGYVIGEEGARRRVNSTLKEQYGLLKDGRGTLVELANGGQIDAFNALAQSLGLVGDEFDEGRKKAAEAASATSTWRDALETLPKDVRVELKNMNYQPTRDEIEDLRRRYNLTPKQVRSILRAIDRATPTVRSVRAELARLDGEVATTTIRTIEETFVKPRKSDPKPSLRDMLNRRDGGVTDFYAAGGIRDAEFYANGGRREDHVAQIAPAGSWRVWAEPETGGEAYIPLAPSKRLRSRAIATETVARLGGDVQWFADGGFDAATSLELTQMRVRIRDLKRSLRERESYKTKSGKKRSRPTLRGLDRLQAKQELAEAQDELRGSLRVTRAGRRRGMGPERYNEYREAKAQAAEDLKNARADAKSSFLDNADIGSFSTPQSVERFLQKTLVDMATFTSLLIELKKKGASPWLLEQLQKAGPSRGTIGLARKYLADSGALKRVNALANSATSISGSYAQFTTDPRFLKPGAWSGGLSSSQTKTLLVNVQSLDQSAQARETTRVLSHELQSLAMGAGAGV